MNHSARVLACRSAPMADAYCHQLCEAFGAMGQALREHRNVAALEQFEASIALLQKLLVFAVVASALLRDAQHPLRGEVDGFTRRLRAALEHAETSIVTRDFAALEELVETGVIPALVGFRAIAGRLASALRPRLAA